MARAKMTFDSVKATKGQGAAESAAPAPAVQEAPAPASGGKRGPGRPPKRDKSAVEYGMTLRISASLRRSLRRAADDATDAKGRVVSVHDIILDAVRGELKKRGLPTE